MLVSSFLGESSSYKADTHKGCEEGIVSPMYTAISSGCVLKESGYINCMLCGTQCFKPALTLLD